MSHPIKSSKSPGRTQGAKLEGYVVRHDEFRNRILDAAEALIAEAGNTSFATRELAIRAGVSAATPFNHFGSKRGILSAIVDRSLERLATRREQPTRLGDPLERIFRNADVVVSYYAAKPKLFRPVFGDAVAEEKHLVEGILRGGWQRGAAQDEEDEQAMEMKTGHEEWR